MEDPSNLVEISDNELDFQEPLEVNIKKRRFTSCKFDDGSEEEGDEIATTCSVCQTFWTNSGSHSIVNLRCGHVFGKSCIDNYIKEMNNLCSYAACPKCRHQIKKSDMRRIWPTKLIPESDQDLSSLRQEIEKNTNLLNQLSKQQIELKSEIDRYKQELENINPEKEILESMKKTQIQSQPSQVPKYTFKLLQQVEFPNEIYNVINLNPIMDMAISSTYNFINSQFGLRKINLFASQITEFVATDHKKKIRNIASKDALVLSTGDDKTLKLTSMKNNVAILSYQLEEPSQACTFDERDTNTMYCGLDSGALMIFDLRNTRSYLHCLNKPKDARSILSVVSYNDSIICSDSTGSYSWFTNEEQEYEYNPLNFQAENTSDIVYSVDFKNKSFLTSISTQQNTKFFVSHMEQCELNEDDDVNDKYSMVVDWSFSGTGRARVSVNRNTLFERNGEIYVCYYDSNQVRIQNKSSEVQIIPMNEDVIDIQHTNIDGDEFLVTSTKSALHLYKFH